MGSGDRPYCAPPEVENIPAELKSLNQWVIWQFSQRGDEWTKKPISALTGRGASTTNRTTWSSFDDALAAMDRHKADGIGFVFSEGDGLVGIDMDDCLQDQHKLTPGAKAIIRQLDSYTEISPSHMGVKIILRADKARADRRTQKHIDFSEIEVYGTSRYFTITGHRWPSTAQFIQDRHAEFACLCDKLFPPEGTAAVPAGGAPPRFSDDEVIAKASAAKNREKFNRLFRDGDTSEYGHDLSRADLALASLVAFYSDDAAQIRRIMERSALTREKWNDRRGESTWLDETIQSALLNRSARYTSIPGLPTAEAPASAGQNLTDAGNAKRFVILNGANWRYCHEDRRWYGWTGTHWMPDRCGLIVEQAKATAATIYAEAQAHPEKDERVRIAAWAGKSESERALRAMVNLAQSEPGIPVRVDDLDADPWLLSCDNGTIDLQNGELRPHLPTHLITKLAPVTYDLNARSETWERFLNTTCGNDSTLTSFLQRAVGYTLTGITSEERFFFCHGPGATGKSTFLAVMLAILGDWAVVADFEAFVTKQRENGPRHDIARFVGARFVASSEFDEGRRLDGNLLKQLTGGDRVSARFLYQDTFEFKPALKLWFFANDAPPVRADDDAIWRRLLRVPFTRVVPKEERDPHLKHKLTNDPAERSAILTWAVQGCLEWQKCGLGVPSVVENATEAYRSENDPLASFFEAMCEFADAYWCSIGRLYSQYEQWARRNGDDPLERGRFTRNAKKRPGIRDGVKKVDGKPERVLHGLRLKSDAQPCSRDSPAMQESRADF